jgi:hypothetical protein
VAILAFDRSGGAALVAQFQMAGFASAMKSVFQVQPVGLRLHLMAVLAFLHRQSLPPDIPATGIVVMTGNAVQTSSFVGLVAEKHRAFGPGLEFVALQGANRFGYCGTGNFGAQKHDDSHGQEE